MRNHPFDTDDREYLAELIRDFPVSPPISLEQASQQIKDRSQQWNPIKFVETIRQSPEVSLAFLLPILPLLLHRKIFEGILGNAGCYRSSQDKYKGCVEFGLPAKKLTDEGDSSNSKFSGVDTSRVEEGVSCAIQHLLSDRSDPVVNAAIFYQQFVRIHPFYDGNGRVGRFIVESYLYHHGMYIRWGDMKRNGRWIRQLNYCHRKMALQTLATSYPFALKWWIHHFRKFVHIIELDPEETPEIASR